jgi:hypothetical protein
LGIIKPPHGTRERLIKISVWLAVTQANAGTLDADDLQIPDVRCFVSAGGNFSPERPDILLMRNEGVTLVSITGVTS